MSKHELPLFIEIIPELFIVLQKYKEKLQKYFPQQTFHYSCQYSRMEEVCGRDRVNMAEEIF
jgi:hypothetical protein